MAVSCWPVAAVAAGMGSSAMFADARHTSSDSGSSSDVLLLYMCLGWLSTEAHRTWPVMQYTSGRTNCASCHSCCCSLDSIHSYAGAAPAATLEAAAAAAAVLPAALAGLLATVEAWATRRSLLWQTQQR